MTDQHDEHEEDEPKRLKNLEVLAFISRFWLRRPWLLAATVILTLVSVGFDLAMPWASGRLIDEITASPRREDMAWAAWGVFVVVYLCFALIRNASFRTWIPLASWNMKAVTDEGFARVQSFSADWHADNFAGATVRRLTRAMGGYDAVSDAVLVFLGPAILLLVGLCVTMLIRWPMVGAYASVVVAFYIVSNIVLTNIYARPANLAQVALDSRIGGALSDAITASPTVKSFGAEGREEARVAEVTELWRKAANRSWTRFTDVWLVHSMLLVALQGGLTGLLLHLWSKGQASPGDVVFAITSSMLMTGYLRNLGENIRSIQRGLDDAENVAGYLRTDPQVRDAPDAPAFRPSVGAIVLDHIDFRYKSAEAPLYDDFSLAIAPGERVALVGPTGSGKSTFVKLVQRLYDLDGGRILIDGQDISKVTQGSLRRAIAAVPQDPALFHRSIAENIAYGRPGASHEDIVEAAKRARAHDFITHLPRGYDTLVGERGVKLSGGERQRVAIARAFLAGAPILVLDEATSSLDVETEREVQAASEALMAGRTTIVIAHRLSTIRGADRILVFDQGRIVEEGRHADLLARGGVYARLHAIAEAG